MKKFLLLAALVLSACQAPDYRPLEYQILSRQGEWVYANEADREQIKIEIYNLLYDVNLKDLSPETQKFINLL